MKNIFRIDNSTYILILFSLLSGYLKNTFVILIIVLIHELGHVFFFILFNYEIESIVIYPFGGVSKVNKKIHERIYKDVLVSLGGILFQMLFFVFIICFFKWGIIVKSTYVMFFAYNLRIILFNLIPLVPLDGSKLLFYICTKFISFRCSYIVMVVVSFISFILFILYNFIFRMNDVVIYVFLLFNLIKSVMDFKYVINKFYLERILYDNYYDGIVYKNDINVMKLNKYQYFREGDKIVGEKNYLVKNRF